MTTKEISSNLLLKQKLLPLFYHDSAEVSLSVIKALYDGGVRMIEYTNRGDEAIDNFYKLRKAVGQFEGLQLGIGTIKTADDAKLFINMGANFIVCPSINSEVGKVCFAAGLLWIPGCMTATEIANAETAGAEIVKIFPGSLLGPGFITAIQSIFPKIKFMVTGGVEPDEENISAWLKVGVVALGMGSTLITKNILTNNDYKALADNTKTVLKLVSQQ
ncbi:MAG: bifunctional 4-hydroxy-2-oxoglutarate aldolase/2-dehydro-3-deoxy-phosphogluconate aldolase [Ginsengibacter sp.]